MRNYSINKRIAKIVNQKGIIQSRIAKAIGMPPETLNRILKCKRVIFADEIKPICDFIGVGIEEVLGDLDNTA